MPKWGLAQLAGACCTLLASRLPDPDVITLLMPLAALCLPARRWRVLPAFVLGAVLALMLAQRGMQDRWPLERDGEIVQFDACVIDIVQQDEQRQRFLAEPLDGAEGLPARMRLALYQPQPQLAPGQCWRWSAKLRSPRGNLNPGGFDYERWLFRQGIAATGYLRTGAGMQRLPDRPARLDAFRQQLARSLQQQLQDAEGAGLVLALALGERSGIDARQWRILRNTGTAHLVAISGLHVGLVATIGWWLLGAGRRRGGWRSLLVLPLAAAYAALAGFNLPVQRALVMLSVYLFYGAQRRSMPWSHGLGVALVAVLLLDPLAPLDTGFWLSFLALAALMLLAAGRREAGYWQDAIRIQAGMSLLLAPVVLHAFGVLPLASIPANLIAIPLFGLLLVPGLLLAMLLLPLGLAAPLLQALAGLLAGLLELLARLEALVPATTPYTDPASLPLAAAGLLLALLPLPWRLRAPGLLLVLPALLSVPAPEQLRIVVLDVGQGQAISVELPAYTLLYDTGPAFGSGDAAERVIIPYYRSRGRRPDLIVVSHGDQDHAGGLDSLRLAYPQAALLGRMRQPPPSMSSCEAGRHWQGGGWNFQLLHPASGRRGSDNNASCVLRASRGAHAILLTGDIERPGEQQLLHTGRPLAADWASMPHHGSRSSSSADFVAAVAAREVAVSAGFGNRWGFPLPEVVARWQQQGARVASSGAGGALIYTLEDGEWRLQRYREQRQAIWRSPVR